MRTAIIREMYGRALLWKFASSVKDRHTEQFDIQWLVTNARPTICQYLSAAVRFSDRERRNNFRNRVDNVILVVSRRIKMPCLLTIYEKSPRYFGIIARALREN